MIVTDKKWRDKGGFLRTGYFIDDYLVENLAPTPQFLSMDRDVVGIISGRGQVRNGKCLGNETKVKINENGEIKNSRILGDYKDGDILETISWDFKNNKKVISESKVIKNNDKKKLYIVELENGNKIRCSMDHKLFVKRRFGGSDDKNVWKIVELKLKDIKEGDELVCKE